MSIRCLGCRIFKWPQAPTYTASFSRNNAAIAVIPICGDSRCMRFSTMYCSNYSIRLHSSHLNTLATHSALTHASHATNTLLLHVEVLLVENWARGGGYNLNAFFEAAFNARIIAESFILYHSPQVKNRSHGFRSGERGHKIPY
jgi:hypothetical protein